MFGINVDPSKAQSAAGKGWQPGGKGKTPDLKQPLMKLLKVRLITAGLLVFITTVTFRVGYVNRRRKIYREFYESYDPYADFERMKRVGVFKSVNPDGSVGQN